ncbi:MAG: GAF domain-containing protein, partial [Candidatus Eremiobacteraeota bacterium]|nr:GAF domain-containing protein [Candidatus Eremiobacteraeota bacterium]
ILSFGMCANLEGRIEALLRQRGWSFQSETKFRAFRDALQANVPPDLVLFDASALPNVVRWLRAVYDNASGNDPKVLAFGGDEATSLRDQALVDDALPHDAPAEIIFSAIKRLVREVPISRRLRMAKTNAVTDTELSAAETAEELASIGANRAAEIMHGWAGVFLVSPEGATFAAERPALLKWAMRRLPRAFLNDRPSFQVFGGRPFFDDAFGSAFDTRELAALTPVSTACIPLIRGDHRLGVLVAVSHHCAADSSMFEALEQLSETLAHRFEAFSYHAIARVPIQRNGVWNCTHSGVFEIAVYRSQRCRIPFRYRMLDDVRGVITIGADVDAGRNKGIVASLETLTGSISYAVRGFPTPLLLDVAGPGGVLTTRRHVTYGSTNLEPPAALFMYDRMLSSWLRDDERIMTSLTECIEDQQPPGLAVLVTTTSRPA